MLEVLDISRAEVKRMVNRYTLTNYRNPKDILNQEYILVCYSVVGDYFCDPSTYNIFYPAVPSIHDGGNWIYVQGKYLDFDSEYIHFFSDGSSRIYCYEIWHLVDEVDEYEFEKMLYGVVAATLDDVLAIEVYERACKELETSEDSPESVSALEYVSAFERAYDIVRDFGSFYPVTTYKRRKTDFALDFVSALSELRLAGCVEHE